MRLDAPRLCIAYARLVYISTMHGTKKFLFCVSLSKEIDVGELGELSYAEECSRDGDGMRKCHLAAKRDPKV